MEAGTAAALPTYHHNARVQEKIRDDRTLARTENEIERLRRELQALEGRRDRKAADVQRKAAEEASEVTLPRLLRAGRDAWHRTKRMDLAGVRMKPEALKSPLYRVWLAIYQEWQRSGFPLEGVAISVQRVAKKVRLSERQVMRHVRELLFRLDLDRIYRGRGRGGAPSRYTFPGFPIAISAEFEIETIRLAN
jgi:hypothetical protein